jgi:hypothetical protein
MKYDLRLKPGFPAPRRVRAGVEVPAGGGLQVDLTDEQVKALQADDQIVMRKVHDEAADEEARKAKASEAAKKAAATRKANEAAKKAAAKPPKVGLAPKQMVDEPEAKTA